MGLSGTCSNRASAPDFAALNEIRQACIDKFDERKIEPRARVPQKVLPVQQTVEVIILEAEHPMRLAEIKPLAEEVLGQPLKHITIKSALSALARNGSSITRVSRGLYSADPP